MESELLASALDFASKGFQIFPCGLDKRPLLSQGVRAATTDQEKLIEIWEEHPTAGVAAVLPKGSFVLDVDQKNGFEGLREVKQLEDAYGQFPETLITLTVSGGRHYYFKGSVL